MGEYIGNINKTNVRIGNIKIRNDTIGNNYTKYDINLMRGKQK